MTRLALALLALLAACHTAPCRPPSGHVTAERLTGCGEPTDAELAALLDDDGTPCLVRERADAACETTLETECIDADGVWEWRGTLTYDGDGYSGILARRELRDGVLCSGEFRVEVR